jgi:hypothetical protein
VLAILALACAFGQEPPKPADESALYDALIKRTNELESFLAVYKATASYDDKVDSIRVVYRAPGECRFEGRGMVMSAHDGILTVRDSSPDGQVSWARVAEAELWERRTAAISTAIAAEFAKEKASWPVTDCGPSIQINISPAADGKHDRFNFDMNYACPRRALFDWLGLFKRSPDVSPQGDERRVMRNSRGSEIVLSTRTGFVESMVRKDDRGTATIELETLDLHPKFDGAEFIAPERPEGVKDDSAALERQIGNVFTVTVLHHFAAWISNRVGAGGGDWNIEMREHAGKVLEVVLADSMSSEPAWRDQLNAYLERFGTWVGTRIRAKDQEGSDSGATIERKILEAREAFLRNLEDSEKRGRPPRPLFGPRGCAR